MGAGWWGPWHNRGSPLEVVLAPSYQFVVTEGRLKEQSNLYHPKKLLKLKKTRTTQASPYVCAMPATQGTPEEFNGTGWESWEEWLSFYFKINGLTAETKKRPLSHNLWGLKAYENVRALVAPKNPDEVTYVKPMSMLNAQSDPHASELFGKTKFQQRNASTGVFISDYLGALRTLVVDCNLRIPTSTLSTSATSGESAKTSHKTMLPLEVMFRDSFLCGVKDNQLQQLFVPEPSLTFKKASDIAWDRKKSPSRRKQL